MKATLTWGAAAVAMVWSSLGAAQIPPKPAPSSAPAASGAAGAPSAPSAVPSADPTAAPAPATEPAPTEVAPAPPVAEAPAAEPEEDVEERPKKRKKKKRKPRYEEEQYEDEDHAADAEPEEEKEEEPQPRRSTWRLGGQHFVLSAERLTSVLAWSRSTKQDIPDTNFPNSTTTFETEVSGTDVGFLGGSMLQNPFSMPRVGFDGIFDSGLTLGGSISYLVSSGEGKSTAGSESATRELETQSLFLLAPRIGVLIPASATVGIWLRGGVTRLNLSSESPATSEGSSSDSSVTYWDLTLDPQLVISPVPHVGITIGAALDIGVSGTVETSTSSTTSEPELSASSYGVTAGLAAIF